MTLSLRDREFVHAARYMGVPGPADHRPPHPAEHGVAADHRRDDQRRRAILAETGLSFFGFGVQPPDVSLGTLIARRHAGAALTFPWVFCFPAGLLVLLVLAVNLVGDGLRDALDPTSQGVRDEPTPRPAAVGLGPAVTFPSEAGDVRAVRGAELRAAAAARSSASSASPARASRLASLAVMGLLPPQRAGDRLGAARRRGAARARTTATCRRSAASGSRWCSRTRCRRSRRSTRSATRSPRRSARTTASAARRPHASAVELLELVGIPQPDAARDGVPARVLRRHAPARDDRDGDRQRPRR